MMKKLTIFLVFMAVNCGAERIHEQKCREYQKIAKKNSCEDKKKNLIVTDELITVNNTDEFPQTAFFGFYNHDEMNETVWRCAGTLISERFVLCTAYCIGNHYLGDKNFVRLGLTSYKKFEDFTPDDYRIIEVHRHPEYKTSYWYYDIALVKLDRDVILSKDKIPACLPTAVDYSTETFIYSFWWGFPSLAELRKIIVNKFSDEDCNNQYKIVNYKQLKYGIQKDIQLCIKPDTYTGEGNVFVFHQTENCMFSILAIPEFQNIKTLPSVKVKVLPFVDWMEAIVWG